MRKLEVVFIWGNVLPIMVETAHDLNYYVTTALLDGWMDKKIDE